MNGRYAVIALSWESFEHEEGPYSEAEDALNRFAEAGYIVIEASVRPEFGIYYTLELEDGYDDDDDRDIDFIPEDQPPGGLKIEDELVLDADRYLKQALKQKEAV